MIILTNKQDGQIKTMFVSYHVANEGYGYMCFGCNDSIFNIHEFLEDHICAKVYINFASQYSHKSSHMINTHRDGKYYMELFDGSLGDVEEVGRLYTYLYDKYGFTNILGFY